MKDVKAFCKYYRYLPGPALGYGGVHGNVLMGEVEPGTIYPCHQEHIAAILEDHSEWELVTKKDYDTQCKADREQVDNSKEQADEKE